MSTARGLFIPAAVLALPGLTLTARLVLAEILNLHQVAGNVFARDTHFADRLGVSVRTIGNAVAELEAQGYLARPYDPAARQKRSLVPTEKCLPIQQGVVADSASNVEECSPIQQPLPEKSLQELQGVVADFAGSGCNSCNQSLQELQGVVADFADINNILNKGETVSAADAATPAPLLAENTQLAPPPASPPAKSEGKKSKPARAALADVAVLTLPHVSQRFAELWAAFSGSPQHAKKALSAFQMMLSKLGKYPEGFAIVMLEAAIERTWSGIENPGTARAYAEWQAEQARLPALPAAGQPAAAPTVTYDVAALFGLDSALTAEQALARNRTTPEYAAYQARKAAEAQARNGTTATP